MTYLLPFLYVASTLTQLPKELRFCINWYHKLRCSFWCCRFTFFDVSLSQPIRRLHYWDILFTKLVDFKPWCDSSIILSASKNEVTFCLDISDLSTFSFRSWIRVSVTTYKFFLIKKFSSTLCFHDQFSLSFWLLMHAVGIIGTWAIRDIPPRSWTVVYREKRSYNSTLHTVEGILLS